jgi:RNA polymerase sigma factor (sigma-70 family)
MNYEEYVDIALKTLKFKISHLEFLGIEKEDVMQEGMIKLLKAFKYYDSSKSSPETFISRVIDNKIKDVFKAAASKKNWVTYSAIHIESAQEINDYEEETLEFQLPDEEKGFEDVIFLESLNKIKWTKKEREVINYLLKGYQKKEIAQKLKLTSASISQTCTKIKNKLIAERMV